jgi:hypothetical protein
MRDPAIKETLEGVIAKSLRLANDTLQLAAEKELLINTALKILSSLMLRSDEPNYSETEALRESIRLAKQFLDIIHEKTKEKAKEKEETITLTIGTKENINFSSLEKLEEWLSCYIREEYEAQTY